MPLSPDQFSSAVDHGVQMTQGEPQLMESPGIALYCVDTLLQMRCVLARTSNIPEGAAIFALVNHPTYLDGPQLVKAVRDFGSQLPIASMTWLENFVGVPGFFTRRVPNALPVYRENADNGTDRQRSYYRKMYAQILSNDALVKRGKDMNRRVVEYLTSHLNTQAMHLVLAATPIEQTVRTRVNERALHILNNTTVPVVPVSFHSFARAEKPLEKKSIFRREVVRFHEPLTNRKTLYTDLQGIDTR
ncbi:hypothetical protein COU76_03055 [Candidatus Peregrinibacteria bacterium CG10_big_fil_rev_8_21_14_0_10_49_10]|nr:MAG: hypothetical protein COU76_03055 [Candidatus Peregrinibacteria bacterium CG10_big_fil_rev_8_21_14_0_10_49_10]